VISECRPSTHLLVTHTDRPLFNYVDVCGFSGLKRKGESLSSDVGVKVNHEVKDL